MAGPVFWAADDTADVLRFYRDFAADAPDELGTVVRLGTIPPLPVIPDHLHWRPAIAVICCYAGAVNDGERAVRALRRLGTPLVDLLGPTPYAAFQGAVIDAVWLPDESGEHAAAETAWARRFLQALQPHREGGVYVNFLDSDDDSPKGIAIAMRPTRGAAT